MNALGKHVEISVITTLDTVADYALFASELVPHNRRRTHRKPVSVAEQNASIVAISQLMISLEGYINRVLYLLSEIDDKYTSSFSEPHLDNKLESIIGSNRTAQGILKGLKEALVLRNAIMHAHLYQTDRDQNRKILHMQEKILISNNRYLETVDPNKFRTKSYRFHVIPSEIGFDDVIKSLRLWNKIYLFIGKKHEEGIARLASYYPYNFSRFLAANHRQAELDVIPLDNNGSFTDLLQYFDHIALYKQQAKKTGF